MFWAAFFVILAPVSFLVALGAMFLSRRVSDPYRESLEGLRRIYEAPK